MEELRYVNIFGEFGCECEGEYVVRLVLVLVLRDE